MKNPQTIQNFVFWPLTNNIFEVDLANEVVQDFEIDME
jgi:hypothetical protein